MHYILCIVFYLWYSMHYIICITFYALYKVQYVLSVPSKTMTLIQPLFICFEGCKGTYLVFDESLLREPLEYSTSSEKETLEFLEILDSLLDDVVDESDATENLPLLGSTTTDSDEQELQLATLSRPSLGVIPLALLRLSLDTRRFPASRSRYGRLLNGYSGGGLR